MEGIILIINYIFSITQVEDKENWNWVWICIE